MDVKVDGAQRDSRIAAALLVLAGGQSRRMGTPKALLPVGGTTLVEWLAGRLGPSFAEVLISVAEPEWLPPGVRGQAVLDRVKGAGPLAGIEAGLATTTQPAIFALACDMPGVTPSLARVLVERSIDHEACVPVVEGRPEPVCAAYRAEALPVIAATLDEGSYKAADLLKRLDTVYLPERELGPAARGAFGNMNSPEDYQAFLDALQHSQIIDS